MARYKRVHTAPPPEPIEEVAPEPQQPPSDWPFGAMLNVRSNGAEYLVTLFPEEHDYQRPERTLRFANSAECQFFVSNWYARQHWDPRAR